LCMFVYVCVFMEWTENSIAPVEHARTIRQIRWNTAASRV
jgi:hypothetical protein